MTKTETANAIALTASAVAGTYVAYQVVSTKLAMRRIDKMLAKHNQRMSDPFANFSPEAKKVLFGK